MNFIDRRWLSEATIIFMCALGVLIGHSAWAKDLARVGTKKITERDLNRALAGYNPGQKANILKDDFAKQRILDSLVEQELLFQEASRRGLDKSKEFRDAVEAYRRYFLANSLIQSQVDKKVTDKSARSFYNKNRSNYTTAQVQVQHILLENEAQARRVAAQAKRKGAKFSDLAVRHSKDPMAKSNKGDLGYIGRDHMPFEFGQAAFRARKGQVVGPVKTTYGYHVIKVVDKKPGETLSFDDAKLRVKADLRQKLLTSFLGKLRSKSKVQVFGKR